MSSVSIVKPSNNSIRAYIIIDLDMKRILIALALACVSMSIQAQAQSTNLIPIPAEYKVGKGIAKLSNCKIVKSEKALLRRLEGRKLADWQLKSAYWLELGKKGVKIVAADEEGVFYARQTLKMMAFLDIR